MTQLITLSKPGTSALEIHAKMVEQNATNTLIKIAVPVSESRQNAGVGPNTRLYDFIRYMNTFKITGMLVSDTSTTALEKYDALMNLTSGSFGMIYTALPITLTYRTKTFSGRVENVRIVDNAMRPNRTGSTNEVDKYEIQIDFIVESG